jgi:hypothetical protein
LTPSQPFKELSNDENDQRLFVRDVFRDGLRVRMPGWRDQSARRLQLRRDMPLRPRLHVSNLVNSHDRGYGAGLETYLL